MSSLQVPAARPAPRRYGEYDPTWGSPRGAQAGRPLRGFSGAPKGLPGLGTPARCVSAADCLPLCCSLAKLRRSRTSCSQPAARTPSVSRSPGREAAIAGSGRPPERREGAGGRFCPRLLSGFGGLSLSPIRRGAWSGVCSLPSLRRVPRGFLFSGVCWVL